MDIAKYFKKRENQKRSPSTTKNEIIDCTVEKEEPKKPKVERKECKAPPKEKSVEKPTITEKKEGKSEKKRSKKVRAIVSSDEDDVFEVGESTKKEPIEPKKNVSAKHNNVGGTSSKKVSEKVATKSEEKAEKVENSEKTTTKTKTKISVSGSYRPRWAKTDREPPQHGMKSIPIGKPNCLEGLTFVLSGLHESLTRDEMSSLISKYGGMERSAVSKKTNYLIAGFEMEDGRPITEGSKYRAAQEKGVLIIDEDRFLQLIYDSDPEGNQEKGKVVSQEISLYEGEGDSMKGDSMKGDSMKGDSMKGDSMKTDSVKTDSSKTNSTPTNSSLTNSTHSKNSSLKGNDQTLLTSKYAPTTLSDIIGNKRSIENLRVWLERWEEVHIHKTTQIEWTKQNPGARAALLSGPPGIGKTTTATLLCRLAGYDVIELNASDKRNMAAVRDTLRDSVSVIAFKKNQKSPSRKVILMDEVDGMSSGDRGGIQELIKIIKTTQTPIICICNDRDSSKVRTLASHCYDLLFMKPSPMEIQARVKYICDCEGLNLPPTTVTSMIESTGGDMRQILNQLQILVSLQEKSNLSSLQSIIASFTKDQLLGVSGFEAGKALLINTKTTSLQQRYDLFFCDYEMTPLIVQQNYLMSVKTNGQNMDTLLQMADAADSLCDCERIHETMVKTNNWSLLPSMGVYTVRSGFKAAGSFVVPRFPMVLGKYSTIRKNTRLLSEFQNHLSVNVSGSRLAIARDYFDMLNRYVSIPLMEGNVEEAIRRLDGYSITKDDYVDILNGIKLGEGKSRFELVPSKTKSAFTRMYNNTNHFTTNVFAEEESMFKRITKGKKGKKESKPTKSTSVIEESESEEDSVLYDYSNVCCGTFIFSLKVISTTGMIHRLSFCFCCYR